MKKTCTFINSLGYSCLIRIGKLYTIPKEHYIYLMEYNEDLVDISHTIRRFLYKCREIIMLKTLVKNLTSKDLYRRELGLVTITSLKRLYYNKTFPNNNI